MNPMTVVEKQQVYKILAAHSAIKAAQVRRLTIVCSTSLISSIHTERDRDAAKKVLTQLIATSSSSSGDEVSYISTPPVKTIDI